MTNEPVKPNNPTVKPNDEISVPVWYSNGGGIMVLRSSLLSSHPDSTYNYIKNVLGKRPEDYGYDIVQLTDEQKEVLRSVPDEAIYEEMRYREVQEAAEDLYGEP